MGCRGLSESRIFADLVEDADCKRRPTRLETAPTYSKKVVRSSGFRPLCSEKMWDMIEWREIVGSKWRVGFC